MIRFSWPVSLLFAGSAAFAAAVQTSVDRQIPMGLYEVDRPTGDAITSDKIALGRKFFFDGRLAKGGTKSCGSCHDPAHGFAEPLPVTIPAGLREGERNSQSVINSGYRRSLGWDGRFRSLEDQVRGSFSPWGDMGLDLGTALSNVQSDAVYRQMCRKAFARGVDETCLVKALAIYQRSIVQAGSRFDRYLFGSDESVLTGKEKAGWELFKGRAGCITCHDVFHATTNDLGSQYALFTDDRFHNLGVGYSNGRMVDPGRYMVSRDLADFGSFKTPMLRDVSKTGPYMHDGSMATLYDVISFYNKGGNPNPNLSPGLKPLFLNENEKLDLVAFLKSLILPLHH